MTPLVSVLIPSFNHEKFIAKAIDSVLAQSYPNWELIICDDGSQDASRDIIASYHKKDERISAIYQENQGVCAALNALQMRAQGVYWVTMGSDDALGKDRLALAVGDLDERPRCGVSFCDVQVVDQDDSHLPDATCPFENRREGTALIERLLQGNFVCAASAVFRKSALRDGESLAVNLQTAQDYELWLRILRRNELHFRAEKHVFYRWHAGNLSHDKQWLTFYEQRAVLEKHAAGIIDFHNLPESVANRVQDTILQFSLALGDHAAAAKILLKKQKGLGLAETELVWLLRWMVINKMGRHANELLCAYSNSLGSFSEKAFKAIREISMVV